METLELAETANVYGNQGPPSPSPPGQAYPYYYRKEVLVPPYDYTPGRRRRTRVFWMLMPEGPFDPHQEGYLAPPVLSPPVPDGSGLKNA